MSKTAKAIDANLALRRRRGGGVNWFKLSADGRIQAIKRGLPAAQAKIILSGLDLTTGSTMRALKLSPATVNRKAKLQQALASDESERVIGLAKLVGQVESMVAESGSDELKFDAKAWLSRWLNQPVPALGGQKPIDLLDTMEGQGLVSDVLAMMQSGAYA